MDYSIVLKIKLDDIEKAGIMEELTGWGEEIVSYSPKRFRVYDNIQLIELETDTEAECVIELKVVGMIRELELQANKKPEMLEDNNLMKLLERICCLDFFCIIIKEDDANIEEVFELDYNNCHNIYKLILDALNWEKPRNIKIQNHQ